MNAQQMIRLQRAIEHVARVMSITHDEHTESDLILMVDVFGPRLNVNEIEEDWTKALAHDSFDYLISDHLARGLRHAMLMQHESCTRRAT